MAEFNIKVVCVGAASQDVFLTGKALTAKRDVRALSQVEQFPLGAKIDVEEVVFDTGGGASNAAVTFARQGLESEFVGKIGRDAAGAEVMRALNKESVLTEKVAFDSKLHTSYSCILLAPNGERTILNYKGASPALQARDFKLDTLQADWLYITSLHGNFDLLTKLIRHAAKNHIKVALDPGQSELAQVRKLRKLLSHIEVIKGNYEEMRLVFGGETPKEVVTRGHGYCRYMLVTDGGGGTYASDGDKLYYAGLYQKVKVVDRTGAGDAFGSGFVAALAQGQDIEDALTLASANATSVVTKIGAKPGILRTHRLKRMKVTTLAI